MLSLPPAVLVPDDSAAAIDAAAEGRIRGALLTGAKDRATIIISHRPYPTSWANRVVHVNYGQKGTVF